VLSKKNFLRIPIKLPPLEEQKRIAAVLNACAQEIRLLEAELEALKQQKRGLMQKLLTGEKRVKP
jgi:type I restriction enzyme S subunit